MLRAIILFSLLSLQLRGVSAADRILPPVTERFASGDVKEQPSFQKHVVPLLGRLGCNGRACHGSFQGQGGFRLSLFGYDFQADHEALLADDSPRVNLRAPLDSLILKKPTSESEHEGGKRFDEGGWEYNLLRRWIQARAPFDANHVRNLTALEISPTEILFQQPGERVQLRAVATWDDGTREDVTPLCRFQSNDSQIAEVDLQGNITAGEPGDTHVVVFYDKAVIPVAIVRPLSELSGDRYPDVPAPTPIDELVRNKLRKLGVVPSELCSDEEFLRRASLDLAGTLPTTQEIEAFLASKALDKRSKKIDELLETPSYAAWWTTKLCDFTGANDDQTVLATPLKAQATDLWYQWIYQRVAGNVPYDQLVEGIVLAVSRENQESYVDYCEQMSAMCAPDSDVRFADRKYMPFYWARNDYQDPAERAIGFAYTFLGIRIECAQCHKHPFDQWSKKDFEDFSKFFVDLQLRRSRPDADTDYASLVHQLGLQGLRVEASQNRIKEAFRNGEVVPFPEVFISSHTPDVVGENGRRPKKLKRPATAVLLDGKAVDLQQLSDARSPLMDWLRDPKNQYFARAFVNRVWASHLGIGIVEPPDSHSLANPPSNEQLLDYLSQGFIKSGFDMKWVHREILNSRTYQLSWRPNATNEADTRNFARAILRRLPAEVIYDAVRQATASDARILEMHQSMKDRAIATPGSGERVNPNKDSDYALTVFGRSTRETSCDCDRSMSPSLLQTVFLQNDPNIIRMLDHSNFGWIPQVEAELAGLAIEPSRPIPAKLANEIQKIQKRLDQAYNRADQKKIGEYEKNLQRLRLQALGRKSIDRKTLKPDHAELQRFIQQAYLRSLSRYPNDAEATRSLAYIEESTDPVTGLRDVLWALINTKEFIVNH